MEPSEREPLHNVHGWRAVADHLQRLLSSVLQIGGCRFLLRKVVRALRVPWAVMQRVPVEGDFTIRIGARQILYHSSLYDAVGRKLFWGLARDYEPETVRAITDALHDGVFLDVGANTGFFSLVAAGAAPGVVCHAFEPAPRVFAALQRNVSANGFGDRIICCPLAISDTPGSAVLHLPERNWSSASLRQTGFRGAAGRVTEVPCTSLDAYVAANSLRRVTVVKIDVEGFEHLVLKGARSLLGTQRPAIVCECLVESDTEEIQSILQRLEDTTFNLTAEGPVQTSAITPDPSGEPKNFLFLPSS